MLLHVILQKKPASHLLLDDHWKEKKNYNNQKTKTQGLKSSKGNI
jgi:hypothetical protein